jgi:hypothetical protein
MNEFIEESYRKLHYAIAEKAQSAQCKKSSTSMVKQRTTLSLLLSLFAIKTPLSMHSDQALPQTRLVGPTKQATANKRDTARIALLHL